MNMTQKQQMELGLAAGENRCPRTVRRGRRLNHAQWWFDQMRQVVEHAMDWEPAPRFKSEQIWLPGTRSQSRD